MKLQTKDKIWLFASGIRSVDNEIQMPQQELVSVAEIKSFMCQKFYVHSCVAAVSSERVL